MVTPSPWALWTLNFQLLMAVMAKVAPQIRELHLEMKEFFLLAEVDAHPNPADLARVLMLPKPSVTFMVKRLEAAGYLRRELQRSDLRRFHLTLTTPGRKAMERARAILDRAFGDRLESLTPTQRATFGRLLEQLAAG